MIITLLGMVIGLIILIAGIYYLIKDKNDPESKKIYSIISAVGFVIVAGFIIKIIFFGM